MDTTPHSLPDSETPNASAPESDGTSLARDGPIMGQEAKRFGKRLRDEDAVEGIQKQARDLIVVTVDVRNLELAPGDPVAKEWWA